MDGGVGVVLPIIYMADALLGREIPHLGPDLSITLPSCLGIAIGALSGIRNFQAQWVQPGLLKMALLTAINPHSW